MQQPSGTWAQIIDFPNYYVSDKGLVWSTITDKLLAPGATKDGYLQVSLSNYPDEAKRRYVHRLVLEGFLSRIPAGFQCNHLDSVRDNNVLSNLEIVTHKQNMEHATNKGNMSNPRPKQRKFNRHQVRAMRQEYNNGASIASLGRKYRVSDTAIRYIVFFKSYAEVK